VLFELNETCNFLGGDLKLNRASAKEFCDKNGITVNRNYNLAKRNKKGSTYWANPQITCLKEDWWILLYDDLKSELHVFKVPANSIAANEVKVRKDKPNRIDMEIRYADDSFQDRRSKIKFTRWHVKTFYIDGQNNDTRSAVYPDDLPDKSNEYHEGKKKKVAVNIYERNPAARQSCIKHYGATCFICGFDFGKVYGKECEGLIHVHHLKMISETDGEYVINPIDDLRPVCPNCHMVLHSKKDIYTIKEVKFMRDSSKLVRETPHSV
jgi:hypothetical protein